MALSDVTQCRQCYEITHNGEPRLPEESLMSRCALHRCRVGSEVNVQHILQASYDHTAEFEFGLDLILDELERLRGTVAHSLVHSHVSPVIAQTDRHGL